MSGNKLAKAMLKVGGNSNGRASTGSGSSDPGEGSSKIAAAAGNASRQANRAASLNPSDGGQQGKGQKKEDNPVVHEELNKNEFIVERIMAYKQINKVRYARVKWLGFAETTWEPAEGIFLYKPGQRGGKHMPLKREAEYLLGRRRKNGKIEYKVHWKGLPSSSDVWQRDTTIGRPDLVEKYCDEHGIERPKAYRKKKELEAVQAKSANNDAVTLPAPLGEPAMPEPIPMHETSDQKPPPPNDVENEQTVAMLMDLDEINVKCTENGQQPESMIPAIAELTAQPSVVVVATPVEPAPPPPVPVVVEPTQPIRQWSVTDLHAFLTRHGFEDAAIKLQTRDIDGTGLMSMLDPAELRKLDIFIGPGLKIVKLIRETDQLHP